MGKKEATIYIKRIHVHISWWVICGRIPKKLLTMVALGRGTGRVAGGCGQEGDLVSVTMCKYYLFKAVNKERKEP